MNYKHTVEAAIDNLNEIGELLLGFKKQASIPAIEIDLVMQKTRNLYEVLLLLKQTVKDHDPSMAGPAVKVTEKEVLADQETKGKKPVSGKEKVAEQQADRGPSGRKAESHADSKKKNIDVLQESLSGQHYLHESFHQDIKYQDLSSRLQSKPITDLSAAIGVNERFLYIRELFNNDAKKYESTVQILNNVSNFNEAYNYMIREFTWDMDSEIVQSLLDLIHRKFITRPNE